MQVEITLFQTLSQLKQIYDQDSGNFNKTNTDCFLSEKLLIIQISNVLKIEHKYRLLLQLLFFMPLEKYQ